MNVVIKTNQLINLTNVKFLFNLNMLNRSINKDSLNKLFDESIVDEIVVDVEFDKIDDDDKFIDSLIIIRLLNYYYDIVVDVNDIVDELIKRFNNNFNNYICLFLNEYDDEFVNVIDPIDEYDENIEIKNKFFIYNYYYDDVVEYSNKYYKSYIESYNNFIDEFNVYNKYDEYYDLIDYINECFNIDSNSSITYYIDYESLIDDDDYIIEYDNYYILSYL